MRRFLALGSCCVRRGWRSKCSAVAQYRGSLVPKANLLQVKQCSSNAGSSTSGEVVKLRTGAPLPENADHGDEESSEDDGSLEEIEDDDSESEESEASRIAQGTAVEEQSETDEDEDIDLSDAEARLSDAERIGKSAEEQDDDEYMDLSEAEARLSSSGKQEESAEEQDDEDDDDEDMDLSDAEARLSSTPKKVKSSAEEQSDAHEDMDVSDAEACLSNAEKQSSGLAQEAGADEASENEEDGDAEQQMKKSCVHRLTVEEISEILKELSPIDLQILDVRERCQWTDHMVFVSGRSTRHIRGMADTIIAAVKKQSSPENHLLFPTVEGRNSDDWMLVDCGHIVVHVFSVEARARYNLEAKWSGREGYMRREVDEDYSEGYFGHRKEDEEEQDIFNDPTFPPPEENKSES